MQAYKNKSYQYGTEWEKIHNIYISSKDFETGIPKQLRKNRQYFI